MAANIFSNILDLYDLKMKDILVVGKLKEGAFEKFMGFMQSDEGMAERKKVADVFGRTCRGISSIASSWGR